jgi:hypothetical protein
MCIVIKFTRILVKLLTIASTLTPKAEPFFTFANALLNVAFAKAFIGFGCR